MCDSLGKAQSPGCLCHTPFPPTNTAARLPVLIGYHVCSPSSMLLLWKLKQPQLDLEQDHGLVGRKHLTAVLATSGQKSASAPTAQ